MGKGLGQMVGHPEDNGPRQGEALLHVSPCLQRAVRGEPNHLVLCGYPEVMIVFFGGLKQEVRYLQGPSGVLPHTPTVKFPASLLHTHTAEYKTLLTDPTRGGPPKILRPGLWALNRGHNLLERDCAWLHDSAFGGSGGELCCCEWTLAAAW